MAWVCSELAEDEHGEIHDFRDVARDVGANLVDLELHNVGQKRGLALVIWKKTGLPSWLRVDKAGTYIAAVDVVTPEEIRLWLEPGLSRVTWVHYDATMCLACLVCSISPVLHFLRFGLFVL